MTARPFCCWLSLFHYHSVALAAAGGLGGVHLFGLGGRNDEGAGRRRARGVGVGVDALPHQRGERLGAVVAQVLVLEPCATPPPPADGCGLSLLVFSRDAACDGERRG